MHQLLCISHGALATGMRYNKSGMTHQLRHSSLQLFSCNASAIGRQPPHIGHRLQSQHISHRLQSQHICHDFSHSTLATGFSHSTLATGFSHSASATAHHLQLISHSSSSATAAQLLSTNLCQCVCCLSSTTMMKHVTCKPGSTSNLLDLCRFRSTAGNNINRCMLCSKLHCTINCAQQTVTRQQGYPLPLNPKT